MNGHLKRFRVTVNTLAPVHIGSGEKIGKKEYIRDGRKIHFPNVARLYAYLSEKGKADAFERFMLSGAGDLGPWLRNNGVDRREWNWGGYRLSLPAPREDKDGKTVGFNEIDAFVKDPYNCPYIPGSGLKGALRNIIIGEKLLRGETDALKKLREELTQLRGDDLRRNSNKMMRIQREIVRQTLFKLERDARGDKLTNDVMAAVRIGDSKPLSLSDLTICEKIDRHIEAEYGDRPLPTFRECLKPGVSVEFSMTVDLGMLDGADGFRDFFYPSRIFEIKDVGTFRGTPLQYAIRRFNIMYDRGFREKFKLDTDAANVIFLGGGSGFLTKTVLLALLRDDRQRTDFIASYMEKAFPPNHKHHRDRVWGVSPHTAKRTEYDGGFYEMGKCEIDIVALKDGAARAKPVVGQSEVNA